MELNGKTLRFIIVGVAGALIYFFCSYLLLIFTELPAYVSSLLAYACSFCFAYLGQRYWAFRSTITHAVTLPRYALLQIFCATFAAGFTQISVVYSDISPLLLSALVTIFTSGISYVVSSCWVFLDVGQQDQQKQPTRYVRLLGIQRLPWGALVVVVVWLVVCIIYVSMYYYMPWNINLYAGHDDRLFVNLAYSLSSGQWLGDYSQFTLMKGPGYAFFLALVHQLGLPLYLCTAVFHCFVVSFFIWCLYRLTPSKILSIALFFSLLFLPMVISQGRIIRDQIYPDQFLIAFSALICSLFVVNSSAKRVLAAVFSGLMFAWLGLTREEGVWVVPTVVLLLLFALIHFWRAGYLKQRFLSSVLVFVLSFLSINFTFQLINWRVYGQLTSLDIKEKNFKAALAVLQSVQEGKTISHVPVSQKAMRRIYEVSPHFAKLKPYFESSNGKGWLTAGCQIYPWTCDEYAGGWFIWALRDAVASIGYYDSATKAVAFFQQLSVEVNQACNDGRLSCQKSVFSYMPKMAKWDIDEILNTLVEMRDVILLSGSVGKYIHLNSGKGMMGDYATQVKLLGYLNSEDRFINTRQVAIFGQYMLNKFHKEKIDVKILTAQEQEVPVSIVDSRQGVNAEQFVNFTLRATCLKACRLVIFIDSNKVLDAAIPEVNHTFKQTVLIVGPLKLTFDKVVWSNKDVVGKIGDEERLTYQVRKVLLGIFQSMLPVLLLFGLIAFSVVSVRLIRQRYLSILWVISGGLWLAILARLTILFLVHISSFPAMNTLYFMPIYSLVLIASWVSLYLFFNEDKR